MISITKQYRFEAAHQLNLPECSIEENLAMFGKCNYLHGHSYYVEFEVSGSVNPQTGMIINYHDLDRYIQLTIDRLDHSFLNDHFGDKMTTAENIVDMFHKVIVIPTGIKLERITVKETAKTSAIWRAD